MGTRPPGDGFLGADLFYDAYPPGDFFSYHLIPHLYLSPDLRIFRIEFLLTLSFTCCSFCLKRRTCIWRINFVRCPPSCASRR